MDKNSRAESRFRFYDYCFYIAGVPLFNSSVSNVYHVLRLSSYTCFITTIIAMFLDMYYHRENRDHIIDVAMLFTLFVGSFCAQFYLRFRRDAFFRMLRFTDAFIWEDLPTIDPVTGSLTMAAWIPRIQKFTFIIIISAITFHVVQSTVRVSTSDDLSFVFGTGYPFDKKKSPAFELINLAQGVSSLPWICIFYSLPSIYGTVVCIACSQLEKLRAMLLCIRQERLSGAETCQEDKKEQGSACQEVSNHMQKQLNNCIIHHQLIIEFVHTIEDAFSPLLAGYFLVLLGCLCFTSYTTVMRRGNMMQLIQSCLVYILLLANVFVFCWFGSELTDQAEIVTEAAWGCEWVGSRASFVRCLSFVIAMAKKDLMLTAGKFVPVSKATMMAMVQESLSLFMFLLQVKEKEEAMEGLQ